jgi:IS30 family transposase
MPRKKIEVDWDQVKKLCAIQCTRKEIAAFMNISEDTIERACKREFKKYFRDLRDDWAEGGKCSLRRKQWLLADKSATMAIFLGKQMLGQIDEESIRHEGSLQHQIVHYGNQAPLTWDQENNGEKEKTVSAPTA